DEERDPIIHAQAQEVAGQALRDFVDRGIRTPGAKGTNFTGQLPEKLSFEVEVKCEGLKYLAAYEGGDRLWLQRDGASSELHVRLPKEVIEAHWLDAQAFGDLGARLSRAIHDQRNPSRAARARRMLPF